MSEDQQGYEVDSGRLAQKYRERLGIALAENAALIDRIVLIEAAFDQVSAQLKESEATITVLMGERNGRHDDQDQPAVDNAGGLGEDAEYARNGSGARGEHHSAPG